jgi:3' terminal RNA ribose 2'-O-methyltransferase Hen1
MYLSIATTYQPATDLGHLLHKHPDRAFKSEGSQSDYYCFFPVATAEYCKACLVLNFNSRPESNGHGRPFLPQLQSQYINDRPYVAGSQLSIAIADVFGTAMNGKSKDRQNLADIALPFEIEISAVHCNAGADFIQKIFEPLGYTVEVSNTKLNEKFPAWGQAPYFSIKLNTTKRISEILRQIYVLLPVLDNFKHYYIEDAEKEKILRLGEGWLQNHPLVEIITQRSLKNIRSLSNEALEILLGSEPITSSSLDGEAKLESPIRLNELRFNKVEEVLITSGVKRVLDFGCGEGRFLEKLIRNPWFSEVIGADVSIASLERATKRLERNSSKNKAKLIHSSFTYHDDRLKDIDSMVMLEVIEHIDLTNLDFVEKNIFEFIKPKLLIITTPNADYNTKFQQPGFRHPDHRFEWTRDEFKVFCEKSIKYGYTYEISFIGDIEPALGGPTQMGVFKWKA